MTNSKRKQEIWYIHSLSRTSRYFLFGRGCHHWVVFESGFVISRRLFSLMEDERRNTWKNFENLGFMCEGREEEGKRVSW